MRIATICGTREININSEDVCFEDDGLYITVLTSIPTEK